MRCRGGGRLSRCLVVPGVAIDASWLSSAASPVFFPRVSLHLFIFVVCLRPCVCAVVCVCRCVFPSLFVCLCACPLPPLAVPAPLPDAGVPQWLGGGRARGFERLRQLGLEEEEVGAIRAHFFPQVRGRGRGWVKEW